jgi:hypothetical protein
MNMVLLGLHYIFRESPGLIAKHVVDKSKLVVEIQYLLEKPPGKHPRKYPGEKFQEKFSEKKTATGKNSKKKITYPRTSCPSSTRPSGPPRRT